MFCKSFAVSCTALCLVAVLAMPVVAQTKTPVNRSSMNPAAFPKQQSGVKPPKLKGFVPLTDDELSDGWIQLFDGVSLYGWRAVDGQFGVRRGVLMNDPRHPGLLRLTTGFVNGTMTGERRAAGGNGDWTPFSAKSETSDTSKAGDWGITLDSGQYRDLRFRPSGMKPLFDGKTLKGWKINPNSKPETKATIENGAIRLTGGLGSLESEEQYADFVLQLEYKTDKPVNSGVFFRCIPGELMNGYECQVFNNPPDEDYQKFMGTDTGGIFRRQVGRNVGSEDGRWNHLTIFARAEQISTWVNGIQTADWFDDRDTHPNPRQGRRLEAGTIQLQGHDPGTDILFRNIRIGIM